MSAACDVDKARNDGQTPAYAAAGAGHGEALDLLLEAGCDIDRALPGKAATPLLAAAFNGRARVARALLQAGADPNKCASDGTSALMVASWHGDAAVVRALLDVGADASRVRNIDGATALYLAAQANHVPVVELLLETRSSRPVGAGRALSQYAIDCCCRTRTCRVRTNLTHSRSEPKCIGRDGLDRRPRGVPGRPRRRSERSTICEGGPQRESGAGRLHSCFDSGPAEPRRVSRCFSCSGRGPGRSLLDGAPVDALHYVSP